MQVSGPPPLPPPPRKWSIFVHADATSNDIASGVLHEVLELQNHAPPSAHLVAQVRREPVARPPLGLVAAGLGGGAAASAVAGLVAAAVTLGVSVAGIPVAIPLAMAGAAGALGLGVGAVVCGALASAAAPAQGRGLEEPAWRGTRTFKLEAPPQPVRHLAAPPVATRPTSAAPRPEQLKDDLVQAIGAWPGQQTVVCISGHGHGWRGFAGMAVADVAEALKQTTAATGRKVDLVVLDGCLMGNLEALKALAPHARFAVASEHTIGSRGLAWRDVLGNLENTASPQALGRALVDQAGSARIPSLALIDLSRIPALAEAVDKLGVQLGPVATSQMRSAFDAGRVDGKGFTDLGTVLCGLKEASPAHAGIVGEVEERLREAVWDVHGDEDGLSGLTVQDLSLKRPDRYVAETGMKGWAGLLQAIRATPPEKMRAAVPLHERVPRSLAM